MYSNKVEICGVNTAKLPVLMEKETGAILYEQNAHDKLEPASVTKSWSRAICGWC